MFLLNFQPNKPSRKALGGRKGVHASKKQLVSLQNISWGFLLFISLLYFIVAYQLLSQKAEVNASKENDVMNKPGSDLNQQERKLPWAATPTQRSFRYWRGLAVKLAALPPNQILSALDKDPFGVRQFEKQLLQAESTKGAFLDLNELRGLFSCPSDRITLPDQRNNDKAQAFRNGTLTHFLFFQHLRKAGGTNFCGLAEHNLPKHQVPHYYCMPDYDWNNKRCAGCFSSFPNEEIILKMNAKEHRILGNEWDPFDPSRFFDLPAVFATSFRKPLDRALSQFRFECIEERGCKIKNITEWWAKRKDLTNVYTWTFSKIPVRGISIGTKPQHAKARQEVIGIAMDTLARFNLVLAMEWLAYAPTHTRNVLGFQDTTTMTERIRPHITQHKREDGQEHNQLGAAGIAKASWSPKDYLSPEQYKIMSENLALDEILTDAARRMFLERIVCEDGAR